MFSRTWTPRPVRGTERRHRRVATGTFAALGLHVGVWAVQLASLAAALHLSPGALGAAVTAATATGIFALSAGGRLADRLGRRAVLLLGFGGTALAFLLLSRVHSRYSLFVVMVLYGLFVSFIDVGANAVGADHERAYGVRVMTGLHAGFSLGALLGALTSALVVWSGVGFRIVYLGLALVLAVAALGCGVAPLPPCAAAGPVRQAYQGRGVWRIPAVAFAIVVAAITFFSDGALESFLSVYLRRALASGVLLSGVGVASYHLASLTGRLFATRALRRWGERRIIGGAGLLATLGISVAVGTEHVGPAIGGLLLVGFAIAPVVPTALSLAGRSAPGRSGAAVAATTAAGYGAFTVSPILIGAVADVTSLHAGLALLIVNTLGVACLALRWPVTTRSTPGV